MPKVKREVSDESSSSSSESDEAPSPPPAKKQKGGVLKRHLQEGSKKGKSKAETDSTSDSGPDDMSPPPAKAKSDSKASSSSKQEENTWTLEKNRFVKISEFRGRVSVDIREYYEKDGKLLPGKKGISLNGTQWQKLKQIIPEVDQALKNF